MLQLSILIVQSVWLWHANETGSGSYKVTQSSCVQLFSSPSCPSTRSKMKLSSYNLDPFHKSTHLAFPTTIMGPTWVQETVWFISVSYVHLVAQLSKSHFLRLLKLITTCQRKCLWNVFWECVLTINYLWVNFRQLLQVQWNKSFQSVQLCKLSGQVVSKQRNCGHDLHF